MKRNRGGHGPIRVLRLPRYAVSTAGMEPNQLLEIARRLVSDSSPSTHLPKYAITEGERVLIVVPSNFDRTVIDAISAAVAEVTTEPALFIGPSHPLNDGGGEKELEIFRNVHGANSLLARLSGLDDRSAIRLCSDGGYDVLLHSFGGSCSSIRHIGIPWPTSDYFATGLPDYPPSLQSTIDEVAWGKLRRARRIRVSDPEGTDITWTVPDGAFDLTCARLATDIASRGHLNLIPFGTSLSGDATGVVAGTINHSGAVPHVRASIVGNRLTDIEGGGLHGDGWRERYSLYANIEYPGHPGPGWNWLFECALGTNPKAARIKRFREFGLAGAYERLRSGVLHFGLGVAVMAPGQTASARAQATDNAAYERFWTEQDVPNGHVHVHNYFPTVELETPDGEHLVLVDEGRLTALDDQRVLEAAAPHGVPDELLTEAWIPAMPGINHPGDYMTDYGKDPLSWIETKSELI